MIDNQETLLVKDIIRVFIFEHWARFYYAAQRDGKVFLEIPAELMAKLREKHPDLAPLLESANTKELSYESCQANVGSFVCSLLDGTKYPAGMVTKCLDSKDFRIELHLFNLWLQGHEGYLEQHSLTFEDWLEMFANWKLMDKVREFIAKLRQTPNSPGTPEKTTH